MKEELSVRCREEIKKWQYISNRSLDVKNSQTGKEVIFKQIMDEIALEFRRDMWPYIE